MEDHYGHPITVRHHGGLVNRTSFFQLLKTRRVREHGIPACATAHEDLLAFPGLTDQPTYVCLGQPAPRTASTTSKGGSMAATGSTFKTCARCDQAPPRLPQNEGSRDMVNVTHTSLLVPDPRLNSDVVLD